MMNTLIKRIEKFLAESGMSATYFSTQVTNNRNWVKSLRDGNGCNVATLERANAFMDEHEKQGAA